MHHHLHHTHLTIPRDVGKVLENYKNFAFKQNLLELSVAFVMANSFNKLVASLTDGVFMPIISYLTNGSMEDNFKNFNIRLNDTTVLELGKFFGVCIDFLIISLFFYVIYTRFLMPVFKTKTDTIKCIYCQMEVSNKAIKCPYCTSFVKEIIIETSTNHTKS